MIHSSVLVGVSIKYLSKKHNEMLDIDLFAQ